MAEPARQTSSAQAEPRSFLESLDEVSEAVESGAGLPEVTRAAGRALDASVIVLDAAGSVLAVACASTEDERVVMAGEAGGGGGRIHWGDPPLRPPLLRTPRQAPPPAPLRPAG